MAHQLVVGEKVLCKFYCNQQNQQAINSVTMAVTGTVGAGLTDAAAVDLLSTTFGPAYKAWMSGAQFYEGMRLQVTTVPKYPYVKSIDGAGAGAGVGTNLPSQVAVCVQLHSATFGRRAQGRVYLPFWTTTDLSQPGYLANTGATKAANWATLMIGPITVSNVGGDSVTFRPQIFSKKFGMYFDIINAVVDTSFATQRRRSNINRPDAIGP